MNILIACEESQRVCSAFRAKGHNAFSCDILECSGGKPEWHIQGDVLPLLNGNCTFVTADSLSHRQDGEWDMIIAFPPCTHLSGSGARWFEKKRKDGRQKEGLEFFGKILKANCSKLAVENPVGIVSGDYVSKYFPELCEQYGFPYSPTQIIHPWQFGDNYEKTTCLWLRGLPKLVPLVTQKPELEYKEWIDKRNGKKKRQNQWYFDVLRLSPEERAKARSKTFQGIANAMAEQWG